MELVELGILVIVVLKARDLKDPHSFSNPLATVSLSNNSVAFSSPVDPRGGQTPVWDYECRFTVWQSLGNPALITISVYSDAEEEDRKLGTAQVSLENWPANESANANEFDAWVQLVDQGKPAGEVFLEMTFYPALPSVHKSTLARRPSKFIQASDRLSRPLPAPPVPTSAPQSTRHAPAASHSRQLPLPGESQGDTWIDVSDRMQQVDINRLSVYSPVPHVVPQPSTSYRPPPPVESTSYQQPSRISQPPSAVPVMSQHPHIVQQTPQLRPVFQNHAPSTHSVPVQQPPRHPQPAPTPQPIHPPRPVIHHSPSSNQQSIPSPVRQPQPPQRQTSVSSISSIPQSRSPPPPIYQAVAEASMPGAFPAPSPQQLPPPRPLMNPYTAPPPPPVPASPVPAPPPPPRKPSPPPARRPPPPRKNLPDPVQARQAALAARVAAEKADALYAAKIAEELRLEDEKASRAQEELDARLIAELMEEEERTEERKRREREVEDERIAREFGEESRASEEERKKREEEDERMAREMAET